MKETVPIPEAKRVKIMACQGSYDDFGVSDDSYLKNGETYAIDFGLKNPKNINWESSKKEIKENNFLGGEQAYVFSEIDNSDKFSKKFTRCIGLVVSGVDRQTGQNISFISHQDPFKILLDKKEEFENHLKQRLNEMKSRCKEQTIDAVMIGGIYLNDIQLDANQVIEHYKNPIQLISKETKNALGFEPMIINGPKTSRMVGDDIYFDNDNRRLYFLRPKLNPAVKDGGSNDFPPSDIKNQESKWK